MGRAPPDLRGQTVAQVAQCFDRAGEQQRLAQRDDLRLEALLARLGQKGLGIGRDDDAGDDLDAILLEGSDLGTEVLRAILKTAGVDEREAHGSQRLRKAQFLVAPSVAVAVVGEQAADFLVRV